MSKKVSAYKADDDSLHESREKAARHEICMGALELGSEIGKGTNNEREEDMQMAVTQLAAIIAQSSTMTRLFIAAVKAHEDDMEEATLEGAGVLAEVMTQRADAPPIACLQTGQPCQWNDHCKSHGCHIETSRKSAASENDE